MLIRTQGVRKISSTHREDFLFRSGDLAMAQRNYILYLLLQLMIGVGCIANGFAQSGVQYQLGDMVVPLNEFSVPNEIGNPTIVPAAPRQIQLAWFLGMEGSKQPQDFGVNANLGGRVSGSLSGPLWEPYGVGYQLGTAFVASANAVQVFELLGASVDRTQSFTTVGIFQRSNSGFQWGFVYDFLFQDSFDNVNLGQWRIRLGQELGASFEVGATVNISDRSDTGEFRSSPVEIEPIDQFSFYVRKYWESGANTTFWLGQSSGHSEDNAVIGSQPRKENTVLFGAEIYAPLNDFLAIYGETNIIAPVDTGAVDAYLGLDISTSRITWALRNARFRNILPVASSTSFTSDLRQR